MARKAKRQKSRPRPPKGETRKKIHAPAKPSAVIRAIAPGDFNSLIRQVNKYDGDKTSATSEVASLIAAAVKTKHLDKRAFAIFRQLDRLEDTKLATTLAHFDHYRRIGGLDKRATAQKMAFPRTEIGEKETPRRKRKETGPEPSVIAHATDEALKAHGVPSVSAAPTLADTLADTLAEAVKAAARENVGHPDGDRPH